MLESWSNRKYPFFIAEMSGNHHHSIEKAFRLIEAAKDAGADAVKIQTYTADTLTINSDRPEFIIKDSASLWYGRTLYDLYSEAHTPWDWHAKLFEHAKKVGILLFSTPFDTTAVDLLEELGNPIYKLASFELMDSQLVEYIAKKNKPIIMSTGVATLTEMSVAVDICKAHCQKEIALLHCISSYPAPIENSNLQTMNTLGDVFKLTRGLSDHSLGDEVAIAATVLGAQVIEKHFVLDRKEGGVDSAFSMEPSEFKSMITRCRNARNAVGVSRVRLSNKENESTRIFSRSLYVTRPMKKGDVFTSDNVRSIRPGNGLHPQYYKMIIGKKCNKDIEGNNPLSFDLVDF